MRNIRWILPALIALILFIGNAPAVLGDETAQQLETNFRTPPPAARPWVYWFWLNSNITREGITADLEAMHRAGIGGVLIMEVDQGVPVGPVPFAGPKWLELFKHVCAEADRLGIEVNMNNDAGWNGSGGPWITPELAMQKVVWSETPAEGPKSLDAKLPTPETVRGYYRDIKVLAFPTPEGNARIGGFEVKSRLVPSILIPAPAHSPKTPAAEVIARDRIVDLSEKMDKDGRLVWDVPAGKWTILRLGHTLTGAVNAPAPASGCGLEPDKMSKEASEAAFAGLMGKIIADVGPLAGKSLVATHIDSWENGTQNWTPKFRAEFQRRRGYDLLPYFPVFTGRIVESLEVSERFLWDLRQTINELVLENYAGHYREMAHRHGLRLTIEAYTACPCSELPYAGEADEPMAEFWSWQKFAAAFSCTEMASGGHVYGKNIIGAEAFTATDAEKWLGWPGNIKELGDWAFCEGINRFVFHRYAMQPYSNIRPGVSMGPWGLHYERTQTWWEMSKAWHEYLARCQYLLRQGLFTADICYLAAEGSPQSYSDQQRLMANNSAEPRERNLYHFDLCPPEALLARMSVKDGRLTLPDGMSYRLLVLPMVETMTPQLLGKIKELLEAGATVVGSRPVNSPSLVGYPECDREVARLTDELWGPGEAPAQLTERKIGKGRLFWSAAFQKKIVESPRAQLGSAQWIWYPEGDPRTAVPTGSRYFRKSFAVDAGRPVKSAQLTMTADNAFTCWINGKPAGNGNNHYQTFTFDIGSLVKPGENFIAVEAVNGADAPNPAGLIASLQIEYRDGPSRTLSTDKSWESAQTVKENWNQTASGDGWSPALELGALGTPPWGLLNATPPDTQLFPEEDLVADVLNKIGVPPDFDFQSQSGVSSLRFIHRTLDGADLYFVANKLPQPEQAVCSFRVGDKRPELWRPDTGKIERPAVYDTVDGMVRMPIYFEPAESTFVIFRDAAEPASQRIISVAWEGKHPLSTEWKTDAAPNGKSAPLPVEPPGIKLTRDQDGRLEIQGDRTGKYALFSAVPESQGVAIPSLPPALEIAGPWDVSFAPGGGAPERVQFEKLISWPEHPDQGVKYYSGDATYKKTFSLPESLIGKNRRLTLDLGNVQVMAEVTLNGKNLGILWKMPYCVDISEAAKQGQNTLEVKVVNLWINRQIGDESLPDDSDRNPDGTLKAWPKWVLEGKSSPTGRHSFTTWRLWRKNDPLQPSGLLGPVRIISQWHGTVK